MHVDKMAAFHAAILNKNSLRTSLWEFPYMQFLVNFMDKAIQDNCFLEMIQK